GSEPQDRQGQPGAWEATAATAHSATDKRCSRPGGTPQKTSSVLMTCFAPSSLSERKRHGKSVIDHCPRKPPCAYPTASWCVKRFCPCGPCAHEPPPCPLPPQ